MPASPPPLWDGYDDGGEDKLVDLLNRKIKAAQDDRDETVDDVVARHLAAAIASHERLKSRIGDPNYHERLHQLAETIQNEPVRSWRPK